MSAHTPGPWTVAKYENYRIEIQPAIGCAYGKTDAEANAPLMAAAPELLAALRSLTSSLAQVVVTPIDEVDEMRVCVDHAVAMNAARAAIAKALGENGMSTDELADALRESLWGKAS